MIDVRYQTLKTHIAKLVKEFATDKSGATAIEYALICALVSVAIIPAITNFRDQFKLTYDFLTNAIATGMK